jgi:hypothetical protein
MASEDTLIGNEFRFQVGDGASPETFANMCAVVEANGIGEESPLIDTTSLCDQARTYRRGLPDGLEIPLVVNFIQGDTQIQDLYTDYKNKTVRNFRMTIADSSPEEYIELSAIIRGWNLGPPVGEKATMTFTLKATGDVNWVFAEAA